MKQIMGEPEDRKSISTIEAQGDKEFAPVTGVHLYKIGEHTCVSVEIGGEWIEVIRERSDGQFSHIVETNGIYDRYYSTSSK